MPLTLAHKLVLWGGLSLFPSEQLLEPQLGREGAGKPQGQQYASTAESRGCTQNKNLRARHWGMSGGNYGNDWGAPGMAWMKARDTAQ
jgi:hypothetical protein